MIDLSSFFKNHFDTDRISDANLSKFADDHLQRLSKTGLYPGLVAAFTPIFSTWSGATLTEATNTAIKEGYTKAVDDAVKALKKNISQQEGTVRGKFGKDSPAYQEFFPQGISEYSEATLADIKTKAERFVNAATAHAADLPGLAAQIGALVTAFNTARNAQLGTKGAVSTSKTSSATTRDDVETQLMQNLLTIALDHIGDPAGGLAFFDQSILQGEQKTPKPKPPPHP